MIEQPTPGKYRRIYADPAWKFLTRSAKGMDRSPDQHYQTMTLKEIKALPVADWAFKDCWLFLWTTPPFLKIGLEVMEAWGFKYSSVAFTWVKLQPNAGTLFYTTDQFNKGLGYTTRKNPEYCLLGRRGSPKRLSNNVDELIIDPRREHSRKPDEAYNRIEQFCAGPGLEMNARQRRPGWDVWGNEVDKFPSLT